MKHKERNKGTGKRDMKADTNRKITMRLRGKKTDMTGGNKITNTEDATDSHGR